MTNTRRRFSNIAAPTTLSGAITGSQTSIVVANASGYPAAPFTIRCELEVMLVTAKSGTTFTVERGYDGTVGTPHADTTAITHVAIAADFRNRWLDTVVYDDSITAYDDEFDESESVTWNTITPGGTATWSESQGVKSALYGQNAVSTLAGHVTSLNGLAYPLYTTTAIRMVGSRSNFQTAGLCFSNGATTAANVVGAHVQWGVGTPTFQRRNGTFAAIATSQTAYTLDVYSPWIHLRLDWVSTNSYRAWVGTDGFTWNDFGAGVFAATVTPTHYGLTVSSYGVGAPTTGKHTASFDFYRVYAVKPTYWQES